MKTFASQTDKETLISSPPNVAPPAAKLASKPTKAKRGIRPSHIIIAAALLLAAVTVPDRNAHETELRNVIGARISASETHSNEEWWSKTGAQLVHGVLRKSNVSYIDMLGMNFKKLGVVSVVTGEGEIISIGIFNQVYFL